MGSQTVDVEIYGSSRTVFCWNDTATPVDAGRRVICRKPACDLRRIPAWTDTPVRDRPFGIGVGLALRVQAQLWSIIETLADLKNPRPVAYVQQANIGNAVQVNNGIRSTEKTPNELLEQQCNEWMDARAARETSCLDPQLEAVAAVNGAEVERR